MTLHSLTTGAAGVALLLLALAGAAEASDAQPAASPPPGFVVCKGCHATQPGKTIVGPSLAGIAGRKAGSLPGFAYSEAMKQTDFRWDRANLDRWLTAPQKMVPGTKMPFTGITDPARRAAVVDYLLTLEGKGAS